LTKHDPVEALLADEFRAQGLTPDPTTLPGTFVVKFKDEVRARSSMQFGQTLYSTTDRDLSGAARLLMRYGAETRQWIRKPESELSMLEARAAELSGRAQPDLCGMLLVSGISPEELFEAARDFAALEIVEFVSIDRHMANLQQGCDPANAQVCERPLCETFDCNPGQPDPIWGCADATCCTQVGVIDPTCGDENDQGGWDTYCAALANVLCAGTVYPPDNPAGPYDPCLFDPFEPDEVLAVFSDVYSLVQDANCAAPHAGRGCNQPRCCASVCSLDPTCCEQQWDATCADLVLSGQFLSCTLPETTPDLTPDLSLQETADGLQGYQYYLQSGPRARRMVDSSGTGTTWRGAIASPDGEDLRGFSGHGFALNEMDSFLNTMWENYQGGEPGANPFVGGGTVKVAVLESSAYTLHEDFILAGPAKNPTRPWEGPLLSVPRVVAEPGVSPVLVEQGSISPSHGTNVLGVLFAADNGFGVTGMAPASQGLFYPTISAEQGYRAPEALASALSDLASGDVINFSWGYQGVIPYFPAPATPTAAIQPVLVDQAMFVLIRLASDANITCVVAAGGGQFTGPIVESQTLDAGAIIVGATYPGNLLNGTSLLPGYTACSSLIGEQNLQLIRYPGSNSEGEDAGPNGSISVCAWGYGVATTGTSVNYANTSVPNPDFALFRGENDAPPSDVAPALQVDRLRSYTQSFGGTSAACAMISGVVARVQAAAKQFYGTGLPPEQVRAIISSEPSSFSQCADSFGDWPNEFPFAESSVADSCTETGAGCFPIGCACITRPIGRFPNLQQVPATILSFPLFGGNATDVSVVTGDPVPGYAWSSFQVRVEDGNLLRVAAKRRTAGQSAQGLVYLASGYTTDVRARRAPTLQEGQDVNNLGIRLVSRATRNYIMVGVFARNFTTNRYEFFGARLLNNELNEFVWALPAVGNYSPYLDPQTGEVDMRVWTCGLGSTARYTVLHDVIDIVINDPLNPL
jgi:hypothetical protein